MAANLSMRVQRREAKGTSAARKLRHHESRIPGIVYGAGRPSACFSVESRILKKAMEQEAFFSQILELTVGRQKQKVVVRDLQRHPITDQVLHVDFMRISEDQLVQIAVPIHYLNEDRCEGVRIDGGIIARTLIEVEISCLPKNLPEYFEIDLEHLRVGNSIHLSDLSLPESVEIVALSHGAEHDTAVVSVQTPRGGVEEEVDEIEEDEGDQDEADEDDPQAD